MYLVQDAVQLKLPIPDLTRPFLKPVLRLHRLLARRIVDNGALGLGVRVVRLDAVLAADAARRLTAAPGTAGVVAVVRVDPDDARLDLLRDAKGAREIARPKRRAEPKLAVVG